MEALLSTADIQNCRAISPLDKLLRALRGITTICATAPSARARGLQLDKDVN